MPDFIIIGAQRCGTSSLYNYLIQHPSIIPARKKEVHYFDLQFQKGNEWYRSNFPTIFYKRIIKLIRGNSLTCEASPYYIFHPLAAGRIKQILPDVKLICILRDPVVRAYSHYCKEVRMGRENLLFEEAIINESKRLEGEIEAFYRDPYYHSDNYRWFSYLTRGHYEEQLKRWFKFFKKDQFFFMISEKLFKDPVSELKKITRFLGLPEYSLKEYNKFGSSKKKTDVISKKVREKLAKYYYPYNERLYNLLGKDFKWQ